jgi:hypothetical protein
VSRVSLIITEVPEPIRTCVELEARHRDISISHVVAEVLCGRYRVAYEPPNYRYSGTEHSETWVMRVPPKLRARLKERALREQTSVRRLCLRALAEHCGLEMVIPRDRRRKVQA